jgi:lipopolysaccharide transport system ATP-binding protein
MSTVIAVEHLSKAYRLGTIGRGTLGADLSAWWAKIRRQPDPLLMVGDNQSVKSRGGQFLALEDVSFAVNRGEVLGIIGRNGAGKSTLLKLLSQVTAPTSGAIRVRGRIASLLEVGTGFHPELSGRENIFMNGAILGMTKAEIRRKLDEIIAFAEIGPFVDTPVKRYSSGMYVRLAFAVAAHLEPEILILDEVLAVGDSAFQKKCLGKMGDVARHGRTILFVSHNTDAISALCSQCVLLEGGKLAMLGATADVVARYLGADQPTAASVDFTAGAGVARLHSASLWDGDGRLAVCFRMGEPIVLKCRFVLERDLRGVQISFSVLNAKGERLFYSSNAMARPGFSVESAGTHAVTAVIPPTLMLPGHYAINLGLHQPNVELYDLREHALAFEVIAGDGHGYAGGAFGHVRADVVWRTGHGAA